MSRWAFEQVPDMDAFQANVYRCLGAVTFLSLFGLVRRVE